MQRPVSGGQLYIVENMSVAHFLIVPGKHFSSKDVLHASQCTAFFQLVYGIKTVTLEIIQPSTGQV